MRLFVVQDIDYRTSEAAFAHFAVVRAQWMILLSVIFIFWNGWVERNSLLKHDTVVLDKDIKRRRRCKWLGFWISTTHPGGGFWSGLCERCWGHQGRLFLKVWRVVSASKVACEKEKSPAVTEDDESWSIWRKTGWKEKSSLKSQKKSVKIWTWGHNLRVSDGLAHTLLKKSKIFKKFPFENEFRTLGCEMNRQRTLCDAVEQRIQSANKVFWMDTMIDVPWRGKCQRMTDDMYVVIFCGSESWSWTQQTLKNIKEIIIKLFRLKRQKMRRVSRIRLKRCNMVRKVWVQKNWSLLYEKIAQSMWRVMGWACDEITKAVLDSLRKVNKWQTPHARIMKQDPENSISWEHEWGGTIVEMCGTRWPHVGQVRKTGL